jgi:hypothetical protein
MGCSSGRMPIISPACCRSAPACAVGPIERFKDRLQMPSDYVVAPEESFPLHERSI